MFISDSALSFKYRLRRRLLDYTAAVLQSCTASVFGFLLPGPRARLRTSALIRPASALPRAGVCLYSYFGSASSASLARRRQNPTPAPHRIRKLALVLLCFTMSARDQPTPPFNSPYQHAMKSTLLQSPAYPSPARSDSEPSKYAAEGLGLYAYPQSFSASGPPAATVLYPPSPQPTEAWSHLSTGTSPLMTEAPTDPWNSTFDQSSSRSPLPWMPHHGSHRSSLSSRDMSIFSREGSEHTFPHPQIKLEGTTELTDDESFAPGLRHPVPMTVTPDRLTTSIFPYDTTYGSPPLAKYEVPADDSYDSRTLEALSYDLHPRSPREITSTSRLRNRRNPTTEENAQYKCHHCNKLFQRAYNHKTHLETHNPSRKKEHVCPFKDCDKQFVRKTDLERHQNSVHRKIKCFRCHKCDAQFARKDTLRRHEEDGCPKRQVFKGTETPSHNRSMRTGPPAIPYYHSPRPDLYDARPSPLFRDESFPGTPRTY
ncbi:hypothetical protein K491DRAFT_245197 [Lophiostoma macrostomum CBS 122681]|uniref:C2H2-type domain-containing protein n=1 Tax=Lophiostoma macrostomum CBS 122681 TaxID=1314788 RepID=A0A6A6TG90_9PLEO|nr:hypothetical protein K491DRAFT_245197 [Lophiostoma macrostomum CBS 122681]